MTSDATPDTHDENAVPSLWETARWFFGWLVSVCGDPCALVQECWLSRKERREILHWLRPVEAIVRRLLVVEAARIAAALSQAKKAAKNRARRGKAAAPRAPFCRVSFPDPEDSPGWSVRFSVYEPKPRVPAAPLNRFLPRIRVLETASDANVLAYAALARAARRHKERMAKTCGEASTWQTGARRPGASRAAGNPWVLARRIEALARVLENPETYARRLARRLHKQAARLARSCRPPPPREPGKRPRYGEEWVRQASEHALQALTPFDTG